MGLLKLAISRQKKSLVSYNGSATELPPFYQTNSQQLQITVVDETGDPVNPYAAVDLSASGLRAVVSAGVTGTEGDEAAELLAATYEAGWAWDAGSSSFLGSINFHTSEIDALIGGEAFDSAILEINVITGGVAETIFGHRSGATNIIINANADVGGAAAPTIVAQPQVVGTKTLQTGVGGVTIADNLVTIAGLALAGAPSNVFIWINAPAGSGPIYASFVIGSATADHFSAILSAIPPNNNYSLTYVLTF